MKYLLFYLFFFTLTISLNAQSRRVAINIGKIQHEYFVDDEQRVTYLRAYDFKDIPVSKIYDIVKSFYQFDVPSSNSSLILQDSTNIIYKSVFPKINSKYYMLPFRVRINVSSRFVVDVNIGQNRMVVKLVVTSYDKEFHYTKSGKVQYREEPLHATYPVSFVKSQRSFDGESFYITHTRVMKLLGQFETYILKTPNVSISKQNP
ncbi:hypothetical protein [Flammeovirga aprica]|uniref:DUF4468 domain-containing protein n=1 Tax=Flammeovirga aprica JL-4 TaxID=694437 RepID=A0A7X9XCP5_9BACT|nr:hypothetical protein [Flammeovirga aprica]NME72056.1 hypothetical protein [Flammeovirga aprica JL-4]